MKRVAIYGAGYLGKQIPHHLLTYYKDNAELVAGFIDDTKVPGELIAGDLRTLGPLASVIQDTEFHPGRLEVVFGVGYSDMRARRDALGLVLQSDYRLFSVIHPQAIIEPGTDPGLGSVVLGGRC